VAAKPVSKTPVERIEQKEEVKQRPVATPKQVEKQVA
jgi:hypothetical protein